MKRLVVLALASAICGLPTDLVGADPYPSRAVSIVVPYPPGGSVDGVARIIVQKLDESLGQHFIVENRAGAGGVVGASHVARAEPDGSTLLLTASIHVITPFLTRIFLTTW